MKCPNSKRFPSNSPPHSLRSPARSYQSLHTPLHFPPLLVSIFVLLRMIVHSHSHISCCPLSPGCTSMSNLRTGEAKTCDQSSHTSPDMPLWYWTSNLFRAF